MEIRKKKDFIINVTYFAIILGIVIFLCRQGIFAIMPFVVAFLVSLIVKPVIRFLSEKCHIQKNIAGIAVVVLFYALIALLLVLLSIRLFTIAKNLVMRLPVIYSTVIEPALIAVFDWLETFTAKLDPSSTLSYDLIVPRITSAIQDFISTASVKALNGLTGTAMSIPGFLINTLIAIIATIFIAIDWKILKAFVLRQCSDKTRGLLHDIRVHLARTLLRYTRSYALIMGITFVEISVGMMIIGVENAFGIALLIAVFDILPVVGSGMILFPWTVIYLIQGDYMRALGMGILYVVVIIVRNIMEPKIVGDRVGLHPIVTLMAMVVGTYVFGGIGLLGLPIALALIQSLNEQGVIHLYKKAGDGTEKKEAGGSNGGAAPTEKQDAPKEEPVPSFGKAEIDIEPDGNSPVE